MISLKVLFLLSFSSYLHICSDSTFVSKEKVECTPLKNCSHLNNLTSTKRFHYGTTTLLTLLHCHFNNGQAYVKCIDPERVKDFMDSADLLPDIENCGVETVQSKISGGNATGIDEYPWIALLKYNNSNGENKYGCHGNLINQRYVLTAAHCVHPDIINKQSGRNLYSVVLGEYDIRNRIDCLRTSVGYADCNEEVKELMIESYHIHPEYGTKSYVNDIALIRMEKDVDLSGDFIKPICLPPRNLISPFNEVLWIAGWGNTENGIMNPVKVKAEFSLKQKSSCKVSTKLGANQYCASSDANAKTCPGDSGGPLMARRKIRDNFHYLLVGVDSLGVNCLGNFRISIYTKVSAYVEWIVTTLRK